MIKTIRELEERIQRHDWRYQYASGRAYDDGRNSWSDIVEAVGRLDRDQCRAVWLRAAPESERTWLDEHYAMIDRRPQLEAEREAKRAAVRAERDAAFPGAFERRAGPVSSQQRKADRLAREAYYAAMRAREEEANERSKAEWAARIAQREASR